jgi:hypothetical protein
MENAQENGWLPVAQFVCPQQIPSRFSKYLALRYKLKIPSWVHEEHRFLKSPDFPAGLESLKATFIMESPASFRKRLIFVPSDPLYRPRRKEGPNHGAT